MSTKKYSLAIGLFAVVFLCGTMLGTVCTVHSVQAQRKISRQDVVQTYEVRIVNAANAQGLAEEANKLGEQGWELVTVIVDDSKGYAFPYTAYLKRARPKADNSTR